MRRAVTTVLAGGVEEPALSVRIWTRLMLWGVGFDRLRRRVGLGPRAPVPEQGTKAA
jgi:hypothetical protein